MATRCNVLLKCGDYSVKFYRHWDGYLSSTGASIIGVVDKAYAKQYNSYYSYAAILTAFIEEKREGENREQYEPTTGRHSDIEFFYVVNYDPVTDTVSYQYAEGFGAELEEQALASTPMSRNEFAAVVNRSIEQMNARIVEMNARNNIQWDQFDLVKIAA